MSEGQDRRPRHMGPRRIGTWRLLEIMQATMPFRAGMGGGAMVLPEYGPADTPIGPVEPEEELPGSNISAGEQQAAVERERARRFVHERRTHE